MDSITTTGDLMKSASSMAAFGQGSADAIMKSSHIWLAGCQAMTEAMTATAQGNMERAMAACQALSHVKSPKEAMDIQIGFARASFEEAVADTRKFVDATTKLGRDATAPMTERLTQAAPQTAI